MEKEKSLYFCVKRVKDGEPPLGVYATKLGGLPYFPKDMEYPRILEGEEAGRPLELLAQINFSELPRIEGFPETGILQFYVGGEQIGMDINRMLYQNGFRVIYHETICTDESLLYSEEDLPEFPERTGFSFDDLPFSSEYALCPREDAGDGEEWSGHTCIGGRPYFTQEDPRSYGEPEYEACDVLLFQLDSEGGVMWGDEGVGNFFISREDLKRRDFSRVMYYWDCT